MPAPATEGVWKLTVSATDDLGQASTIARTFRVNSTLGFLTTSTARLSVPPRGRNLAIGWQQTRRAQVAVTMESPAGTVRRTLARRSFEAGTHRLNWRGLLANGKRAPSGPYVVRVVARNELGTTRLVRSFVVRRIR